MKKIFFFVVVLLVTSRLSAQTPDRTVNFTPVITGVPNYTSLTSALNAATNGDTIWVAAGIYKETEFTIPAGKTVIGGFPVYATSLSQRIYPGAATPAQLSILDGSYTHRVATVRGTLDGFVITKGYVYDASSNQSQALTGNGGGTLIDGGIVQNCILHDNVAAKLAPSSGTIPGTFVASVGDIYCVDGTLIEPTYSNSNGNYIATLPVGYSISSGSINTPNGTKIPQGIVFYVDSSPTKGNFLIMGKPASDSKCWTGTYTFNITTLADITDLTAATSDMNGKSNTQTIVNYVNSNFSSWDSWQRSQWDTSVSAVRYANEYNYPTTTQNQWYLPSAGELYKIWNVHPQMDACALLLSWISGSISTLFPTDIFWSSSEYNAGKVWVLDYTNVHSAKLNYVDKTAGSGHTIPIASKTLITN